MALTEYQQASSLKSLIQDHRVSLRKVVPADSSKLTFFLVPMRSSFRILNARRRSHFPARTGDTSQSLTLPSQLAETMVLPSEAKRTALTPHSWAGKAVSDVPVATSRNRRFSVRISM